MPVGAELLRRAGACGGEGRGAPLTHRFPTACANLLCTLQIHYTYYMFNFVTCDNIVR